MGNRRRARELAMQALFYIDMRKGDPSEMLNLFCKCFKPSRKVLPFFLKLVQGVLGSKHEIDAIIENFSSNWKVSRMSCVDRNVMRIAVYELLFLSEIPSKVSINEAVDIGKKFGTEDSGAFINGILDSIRIAIEENKIPIKTATEDRSE
ncbi:MAG: transcription antitermination factor NusB [Deltaproteobacteria bacterium]|nr:transcription antitermination factor NusB [Deltaproteobacteria bacterium]MBW1962780.1 transcription antitermination factor NusB [Deltaproteobacteria bacterium]MBW2153890.1 transcription antitermination factor NusB [Deltaproteobacteria bacterium]